MESQRRTRIRNIVVCLIMGPTFGACASGSNIMSDHDHSAPYESYKTYNFIADAGPKGTSYQSFFSKYVVAAIKIEMENRGYTISDDPDLLVAFNAILQEKTKVSTTSAPPPMMGGYYGYRGGHYGAWGGYGYGTETRVSQYTEGTFNIDIVDARKHQLVWEAVGVAKISQKKLDNLEEAINKGVPRYFSLYPFIAGGRASVTTE